MCLLYSPRATADFRRRHKGHKTVRVWKVLEVAHWARKLRGKHYSPPGGCWCPGLHTSDREKRGISEMERRGQSVYHGFHVYLRRKDALTDCVDPLDDDMAVVPFTARLADLVACEATCSHAVFTQLTLSKRAHSKALCQGG